ncbi:recombinase family protein, partial [Arthrobacter sp. ISL-48]|uniref:recombinase family protein n=1 Tax=Arthrobacter sp. ISL-48 TaxID=2819110 RepID=UPI0028892479
MDKKSGATTDRPGLKDALRHARAGDVLVVHTLDWLGRTVRGTLNMVPDLRERGVGIRILADPWTSTPPCQRATWRSWHSSCWRCSERWNGPARPKGHPGDAQILAAGRRLLRLSVIRSRLISSSIRGLSA